MTKVFTLILFFNSNLLIGQRDTIIYYTKADATTESEDKAVYYNKVSSNKKKEFVLTSFVKINEKWQKGDETIIKYNSDSTLSITINKQKESQIIRVFHKTDTGYYIKDYSKSFLREEGFSKLLFPLVRNGYWKISDPLTGKMTTEAIFSNNRMMTNKYWVNESVYFNDVYINPDKLPEYEGGYQEYSKFIAKKLVYPESAKENNITGTVIIGFIVMKDGSINGYRFIKKVDPILDIEALRVVSSIPPKWTPGEIDNKKVNVTFAIPVTFKITNSNTVIIH